MGAVALLSGPVQLWLGISDSQPTLHRRLGMVYVTSVVLGAGAAYYLAFNTGFGWVYGAGLVGLATAWVVTTGLAFTAIRRGLIEQHLEWMVRSYVVTFAFVVFRVLSWGLQAWNIGTFRSASGSRVGSAGRCLCSLQKRSFRGGRSFAFAEQEPLTGGMNTGPKNPIGRRITFAP
jgi:hypothetical protein